MHTNIMQMEQIQYNSDYPYQWKGNNVSVIVNMDNPKYILWHSVAVEASRPVLYSHLPYFSDHKTHQTIRRTMIFSLDILEKNNDECILILVIYWKKKGLVHTKISNHNTGCPKKTVPFSKKINKKKGYNLFWAQCIIYSS